MYTFSKHNTHTRKIYRQRKNDIFQFGRRLERGGPGVPHLSAAELHPAGHRLAAVLRLPVVLVYQLPVPVRRAADDHTDLLSEPCEQEGFDRDRVNII